MKDLRKIFTVSKSRNLMLLIFHPGILLRVLQKTGQTIREVLFIVRLAHTVKEVQKPHNLPYWRPGGWWCGSEAWLWRTMGYVQHWVCRHWALGENADSHSRSQGEGESSFPSPFALWVFSWLRSAHPHECRWAVPFRFKCWSLPESPSQLLLEIV